MKRTFVYTDEKSNKFWTIEIINNTHVINFGKTGTAGQTQTKEFTNEEECRKAADKLIAEKTKKGYKEEGTEECPQNIDLKENRIPVNLENVSDLKRVLNILINNIDQISEAASPNDGLIYGKTVDGEFEPFEEDAAESEAIFFNHAAQHKELHKLIIQYAEMVDKDQFVDSMSDMRMGMNAVFALASQDEKYIPLFIEHHRKIRPGGGEWQMDHIIDLLSDTNNGLKLLAACCMYVIDQPDIENNIEPWIEEYVGEDNKKQKKVFGYMMQEAAKMTDHEFLVDYVSEALNAMGVEYDEEKLEEVLEEIDEEELPKLKDVI